MLASWSESTGRLKRHMIDTMLRSYEYEDMDTLALHEQLTQSFDALNKVESAKTINISLSAEQIGYLIDIMEHSSLAQADHNCKLKQVHRLMTGRMAIICWLAGGVQRLQKLKTKKQALEMIRELRDDWGVDISNEEAFSFVRVLAAARDKAVNQPLR